MLCLILVAINSTGYSWFLDNVVNNEYGKWPLVVGSDEFVAVDFEMATVAGE